ADRLVAIFREEGFASDAFDVASPEVAQVDWRHVRAAVVGASLHAGRHQRSAEKFVRAHAADLNAHPSAFFSVSQSLHRRGRNERRRPAWFHDSHAGPDGIRARSPVSGADARTRSTAW